MLEYGQSQLNQQLSQGSGTIPNQATHQYNIESRQCIHNIFYDLYHWTGVASGYVQLYWWQEIWRPFGSYRAQGNNNNNNTTEVKPCLGSQVLNRSISIFPITITSILGIDGQFCSTVRLNKCSVAPLALDILTMHTNQKLSTPDQSSSQF